RCFHNPRRRAHTNRHLHHRCDRRPHPSQRTRPTQRGRSGMSIYYEDDYVTLYHGDCLVISEWWAHADVLVTDPPYGSQPDSTVIGYGRKVQADGFRGQIIANDTTTATRDAALTKWGTRAAVVFASPRLPEPPGEWADRLVWNKTRPGMNGGAFRYTHEAIYARGMVRINNSTFSILTAYPDQSDHIHAKPASLMGALVEVCPPGVIADPFAGSGSTLVAAKRLGRRAIGVELEEKYCEIAARRLSQDV